MSIHKYWLTAVLALGLVACGGGGGSAGTSGGGTGGTGGGTTQPVYQMTLQLQNAAGVDIANNSFAASDTVKLLATLKTAAGVPASDEIVSFAESGGGLLQLTPVSATALTNASGQAVMEAKAKDLVSPGATTVTASATVAGTVYSVSRNLSVTRAVGGDPQALAKAVNFVSAAPADKSIVIAGAGGNGRSETAILQYNVVDAAGVAVAGVRVAFEAIPADAVVLNSATGTTDASGNVAAYVSSKNKATSVAVKASVIGSTQITQSDTLTVTTGPATAAGFDLSADKYVLNNRISGDASNIRIAVVDENGNPVADGFPVVTTTIYGRVGSADRGGCLTLNGICSVEYQVQDPRAPDGVAIPVVVTAKAYSKAAGRDVEISKTIFLNATDVSDAGLYDKDGTVALNKFEYDPAPAGYVKFEGATGCKAVWTGFLGTVEGFAAPGGASLSVKSSNDVVGVAVTSGASVPDSLNSRTAVALTFTLNNALVKGTALLEFTVQAGTRVHALSLPLNYPACIPPV